MAVEDVCGDEPGAACRWVYEQTDNEALARAADWLVDTPLQILLICLVAWITSLVVRRAIRRFTARLVGSAESGRLHRARSKVPGILVVAEPSVRSAARAETVAQVLHSLSAAVIWGFAAVYVLAALGVQLGPLIAGAGVVGVALGFGAQSLVRDYLSGLFMLLEDQYGVGDTVDLGEAVGTVEAVSLRVTRLRDVNGTVWHVPNGEVRRVGNQSQQWARAVLDVQVAPDADVPRAEEVLKQVADAAAADEALAADVLSEPEVWGVEAVSPSGITLRLVVKTRPGAQWSVMRALRARIAAAFREQGIPMPPVPGTIVGGPGSEPPGGAE